MSESTGDRSHVDTGTEEPRGDVVAEIVKADAVEAARGEFRAEQNDDNLNGGARPLYTFAGLFNFANDAPLFYQINADPRTGGLVGIDRAARAVVFAKR